nr:DUF624 domain-containing protein [Colidextribacter sp. OB.20]
MVDVAGLSLLWMLLCLPVVTAVPATAALYYAVVKCVRRRESGAFRAYLRAFRDNLKTGLLTGLILLPAAALLLAVHHIARWYGIRAGGVLYLLYVAQYFALMIPAGVLCWLFPLLGRFEYGVRDLFRTAFQLTVAHLPSTVVLVLLTAQSAVFCAVYWWPVLFLPAAAMLLASLFTERIFGKYAPELAEPEEASEEE